MSNGFSHRYLDADDASYDENCDCDDCRAIRDKASRCINGVYRSDTSTECDCSYHQLRQRQSDEFWDSVGNDIGDSIVAGIGGAVLGVVIAFVGFFLLFLLFA